MNSKNNKKYWLDQPKNINKIVYLLYAACVGLLIVEFFYHKHGHFDFEQWFGFYAWFGFIAYISIVMSAKLFRKFIKRKENYYD
jgi:purine-cytosine permease-like protein